MLRNLLFISALLSIYGASYAQDYVSTERININNNTSQMPKGRWQMETGLSFEKTEITYFNIYQLQSPVVMQRYGLSNRVELRLRTTMTSNYAINKGAITTNYQLNGLAAPELGAKIQLFEEKKLRPKIAVLAQVNVSPLASKIYRSEQVTPIARVLMSHSINEKLTVGYNLGTYWHQYFVYTYDVYVQKKWGKSVVTNLEYNGNWTKPNEMYQNYRQYIYSGLGYYIDPNVLCDVGLGRGINNAPDYFFRFGFSFGLKK